jgi:hypothetical protein
MRKYDAAKEAQGMLEAKISNLEGQISLLRGLWMKIDVILPSMVSIIDQGESDQL